MVVSLFFFVGGNIMNGCMMLFKIGWSLNWDFVSGCFIYLFIVGGNNIKWPFDAMRFF